MSRRGFRYVLVCVGVVGILAGAPPGAALASSPRVSAPAVALFTMDGTELWSRKSESKRPVASTTKLLTALVVLDHASLDDVVTVSHKAVIAVDEGGVGLRTGQRLTVRQLMTMMLVASANDAAEVLAVHVAGSESKFVRMMDVKAASLGLEHTRAVDPHGLGERGRYSAADLAAISRELMSYPEIRKIVAKKSVTVPGPKGTRSVYSSTDQLLGKYKGIEGIKTGFTNPAGYCFVGAAKRGDTELVGVVLGASTGSARFADMRKLLDWGFAHYRTQKLVSDAAPIGVVAVGRSGDATVSVRAAEPYSVLETIGAEPATVRVILPPSVPTSVWRGQQLGTAEVSRSGSVIATVPLLAEAAVCDPDEVRPIPVKQPPAAAPKGNALQRMVRASTHAMGLLSLSLLGTPANPQ